MYLFLKKVNDFYAGEGHEWYVVIATANDRKIAEIINNSIPYRDDKENILCIKDEEQYHNFDYSFTHKFDETLPIY